MGSGFVTSHPSSVSLRCSAFSVGVDNGVGGDAWVVHTCWVSFVTY